MAERAETLEAVVKESLDLVTKKRQEKKRAFHFHGYVYSFSEFLSIFLLV